MPDLKDRLQATLGNSYKLEREIGVGGMATVYLACDLKHDRDVALKVLRPELSAVLGVDRFLNEIKIAAQLDHPHILTLIDSGEADGLLYYVLPYVRGESLRRRLEREQQLSVDEALAITRQIASALDYAHAKGVVHRDVKPENILIHEGEAVLTDFGIAMAVKHAGGNRLTETGLSLGTPQYMSPEQATGDRTLDARSDVYSLAAVLYEMLAGEPPHTGPTSQAVIAKLMTERPTRLRILRDTVPEGVDIAVAKALAKVPADRYANSRQFAAALSAPAAQRELPRVRWDILAAAAGVLIVVGIIGYGMNHRPTRAAPPRRMQLTTSGNAYFPSVSPDGNRIAYAERECDKDDYCSYRLVVQDIAGTGRLVLTGQIGSIWATGWTADGRYLLYGGAYNDNWGAYAVPTLGGSPRRLGCCLASAFRGDTVVVAPTKFANDSVVWIRYVTVTDGIARDSVPITEADFDYRAFPTDDPNVLVDEIISLKGKPFELRLLDRKGRVLSHTTVDAKLGMQARWLPGQSAILLSIHEGDGEFDLVRLPVNRGRLTAARDTVVRGVPISSPNTEGWGWLSVGPQSSEVVVGSNPYEASIWSIEHTRPNTWTNPSRILTATKFLWSRISLDGRQIVIGRSVTTTTGPRDQLLLVREGGEPRPITPLLEDVRVMEWKANGTGVLILNLHRDSVSILDVDTSGTRTREILRLPYSVASDLKPMRDGSFVLLDPDAREIRLLDENGRLIKRLSRPRWMPHPQAIVSDWSDSRHFALCSFDQGSMHIIVSKLNPETGSFDQPAVFPSALQGWGRMAWLDDGRLVISALESRGSWGLYEVTANGGVVRLDRLPQLGGLLHTTAGYTMSGDGRHFSANVQSVRSDVYSIRNFGDLLRERGY